MKKFKFWMLVVLSVSVMQGCSVESNNHLQTPHTGWYQDPMNPKYAMKKVSDHKSAITDTKYSNIIKQ